MENTNIFIHWKGTNICMDFTCSCGYTAHVDGSFIYNIRCSQCLKIYKMPKDIQLVEVEKGAKLQPDFVHTV